MTAKAGRMMAAAALALSLGAVQPVQALYIPVIDESMMMLEKSEWYEEFAQMLKDYSTMVEQLDYVINTYIIELQSFNTQLTDHLKPARDAYKAVSGAYNDTLKTIKDAKSLASQFADFSEYALDNYGTLDFWAECISSPGGCDGYAGKGHKASQAAMAELETTGLAMNKLAAYLDDLNDHLGELEDTAVSDDDVGHETMLQNIAQHLNTLGTELVVIGRMQAEQANALLAVHQAEMADKLAARVEHLRMFDVNASGITWQSSVINDLSDLAPDGL